MSQETKENEAAASANDELTRIFEPREFVGGNKIPLKYRLLKPLNYRPGKKYPLVLFLHGAGERGDDNLITIQPRPATDLSLDFSPAALYTIAFGFLLVLPLVFGVTGIVIWWRRRRR